MFIFCISYRKQRHRFALQNLNVKKNSVTDIKIDLKLCFPGKRTVGSAMGTEGNLSCFFTQTAAALFVTRGDGAGVPRMHLTLGPITGSAHGPPARCWLALRLRVQPGTSLGSKAQSIAAKCRVLQAPGMLAVTPQRCRHHRHRLPPPPPAFEGPQSIRAAFRGAQAGVLSPSPQLPQ